MQNNFIVNIKEFLTKLTTIISSIGTSNDALDESNIHLKKLAGGDKTEYETTTSWTSEEGSTTYAYACIADDPISVTLTYLDDTTEVLTLPASYFAFEQNVKSIVATGDAGIYVTIYQITE